MSLKKASAVLLAGAVFVCSGFLHPTAAADKGLSVSAQSAILVNATDGSVLWAKNAAQKRPMASTTKIMTALLTLEEAACSDRTVQITADMLRVEGTSMGLQAGDRVKLSTLAAGMLSTSGNDAATAVAFALDGGPAAFAKRMNQRAKELKMNNTHFVTPSGLDDAAHYSTAEDMAKLACAAMKNDAFAAITAQKSIKVHFEQPACTRVYQNHNKLLTLYRGCIGVKTGFTKKSGRCLVSCAQRNGVRLIAVTLCAPDDWRDHQLLLDYGFSRLKSVSLDDSSCVFSLPLVGGKADHVQVRGETGSTLVIPKEAHLTRSVELPHFVYAPLEKGEVVGQVIYRFNGSVAAQIPLTAEAAPAAPKKLNFWRQIIAFFGSLFSSS
ncbi:MAG: D-alanyl-D-alanine carboxypeptidase [Oscillospiraceae bacterium]|nr:D-alanyl-D-alanine carboxypeptidase [Oscillospiraceae bacterium]MDD3261645.1 D-alanyl-D-alanine carboxypeptidase [Oscillospiraceae bacterium]